MSSAREEILANVRNAVKDVEVPHVPREYRREASPAASGDLVELLVDRLEDYRAHVIHCGADDADISRAIRDELRAREITTVVSPKAAVQRWLSDGGAEVDGSEGEGLHLERLLVDDESEPLADWTELDAIEGVVTGSALAIAETGVVVLDGGPLSGRRAISLVPDVHICVVRTEDIVALPPEAVSRLDATSPQTWIAGPSATSDIELDRVEGVHGPRTLIVIIAGAR